MKSPALSTAVALLLAALAVSCSTSTPIEPPASPDEIIPLSVGNEWSGVLTKFDSSRNILEVRLDGFKIVDDTVIDGERRFRFDGFYSFVANRRDGVYDWSGGTPQRSFRFPAIPGDRDLQVMSSPGGFYTDTTTVISTTDRVTVPAGTFTCYHYLRTRSDQVGELHHYMAPGLGFVKAISVNRPGDIYQDGAYVWELRKLVLR